MVEWERERFSVWWIIKRYNVSLSSAPNPSSKQILEKLLLITHTDPFLDRRSSTLKGSCTAKSASVADFTADYIDYLSKSWQTQTWVYEQASGWVYWWAPFFVSLATNKKGERNWSQVKKKRDMICAFFTQDMEDRRSFGLEFSNRNFLWLVSKLFLSFGCFFEPVIT